MATISDIGNTSGIRPVALTEAGDRLGLWGRYIEYGGKVMYSGPLFRRAIMEGDRMRVWFLGSDGSLQGRGGEALRGFEVCGGDRRFFPADAKVDGDTVVVSSPSVPHPVSVRYAWATDARWNLVGREDTPGPPLRSILEN